MTTKEINQLKAFTTMPHINERPPYARHTVLMPRVASLTATGNNVTFLTELGFEQMRTKRVVSGRWQSVRSATSTATYPMRIRTRKRRPKCPSESSA